MRRRKIRLISGLPLPELTRRVHYYARKGETSYRALGYYRLDLDNRGGFRPGFSSAGTPTPAPGAREGV